MTDEPPEIPSDGDSPTYFDGEPGPPPSAPSLPSDERPTLFDDEARRLLDPGTELPPELAAEHQAVYLRRGDLVTNRFQVIKLLGFGGMGAVYRVRDRVLNEDRALKVMLPSLLRSETARQRFLSEVRISQKLNHDRIVRVHDLGEDPERGFRFFTMEYVEGQTLNRLLKERGGKLPVDEALDITRQLCDALEYAHQHTVHRDLKPQNVMVQPDGRIKVLDFGLAKLMSPGRMTRSSMALGTAYYQAPEQSGGDETDKRSDIYSVGVLLYEMLTSRKPVGNVRPPSALIPGIGPLVDRIVMKCVEFEPQARYSSCRELAGALGAVRGEVPTPPDKQPDTVPSGDLPGQGSEGENGPGRPPSLEEAVGRARGVAWQAMVKARDAEAAVYAQELFEDAEHHLRNGENEDRTGTFLPAKARYEEADQGFRSALAAAKKVKADLAARMAAKEAAERAHGRADESEAARWSEPRFNAAVSKEARARDTSDPLAAARLYREAEGLFKSAVEETERVAVALVQEAREAAERAKHLAWQAQSALGIKCFMIEEAADKMAKAKEMKADDIRAKAAYDKGRSLYEAATQAASATTGEMLGRLTEQRKRVMLVRSQADAVEAPRFAESQWEDAESASYEARRLTGLWDMAGAASRYEFAARRYHEAYVIAKPRLRTRRVRHAFAWPLRALGELWDAVLLDGEELFEGCFLVALSLLFFGTPILLITWRLWWPLVQAISDWFR